MRIRFQFLRFGLAGFGLLLIIFYAYWSMVWFDYSSKKSGRPKFDTQGTPRIAVAAQMEELFGISHRTISYGKGDTPVWHSELVLHGRYGLRMFVPVKIHSPTNGVVAGNPVFLLDEITEVQTNFTTGVSHMGGHWKFGQKEWDQLYRAKGDFSVIGIVLRTNEPVKNVEAYIKERMR